MLAARASLRDPLHLSSGVRPQHVARRRMEFLSHAEARAWTERAGFGVNASFTRPIASELVAPLRFGIPEDSGARVALARALWDAAGAGVADTLVWVTEWGVWPSGEHPPLAEAARRGLGAAQPLQATPGHLARAGESDAGLSVLCLAVLFLWDCWVLPTGGSAVFVSHDEYGAADAAGGSALHATLGAWGLAYDAPAG